MPESLLPTWFGTVAPHFPEGSAERYRVRCGRFLMWCRDTRVDPLRCSPRKIAIYRDLLAEGDLQHVPIGAGTIRAHLTALRCMYRLAEEHGLIPDGFRDPSRHIRLPRYVPGPQPRANEMQRRRLLDQADQGRGPMRNRNRAVLGLLVYLVPRAEEIAAMPLGAYTPSSLRELTALQWTTNKGEQRGARVPSSVAAAVELWLREREDLAAELRSEGLPVADRMFITSNGRPLPQRHVYKLVIDTCRAAGLPHLPPHAWRRGAIREGRRYGASANTLQRWAGWKDPKMVDRYAGEQAVPYDDDPGLLAHQRDQVARAAVTGFPISNRLEGDR